MSERVLVTGDDAVAQELSRSFVADGWEVVRLIDRGPRKGRARAGSLVVDFGHDAELAMVVDRVGGPLHALAICYPTTAEGSLATTSPAEWRRSIEANLTSAFVLLKTALSHLVDGAAVVLVSSTAGIDGGPGFGPQAAAIAAGHIGLVRHLNVELAKRRIRINAVCVAHLDDGQGGSPGDRASTDGLVPLRRLGRASEVVDAVRFLIADGASFMTGAVVSVSGGSHR